LAAAEEEDPRKAVRLSGKAVPTPRLFPLLLTPKVEILFCNSGAVRCLITLDFAYLRRYTPAKKGDICVSSPANQRPVPLPAFLLRPPFSAPLSSPALWHGNVWRPATSEDGEATQAIWSSTLATQIPPADPLTFARPICAKRDITVVIREVARIAYPTGTTANSLIAGTWSGAGSGRENFMGWRRSALFVAGLAAAAVGGTFLGARHLRGQAPSTTALTADITEELYAVPSGELRMSMTWVYTQTSNGSYARERIIDGKPASRVIVDFSSGRRILVDHLTESLSTTYLRNAPSSPNRQPQGCGVPGDAPQASLLGYEVRLREAPERPGENLQVSEWVAPSLNCFPLKVLTYRTPDNGGPAVLVNAKTVTRLTLGEPSGSPFVIPSGYVERSPSAILAEFNRRYPGRHARSSAIAEHDAAYAAGQQQP
jgi:hypothetical protein